MDKIYIKNLLVQAKHGVFSFEKEKVQNFVISICIFTNTQAAAFSDSIADTINYADVSEVVCDYVINNSFDLLETIAENVCTLLLSKYKMIDQVDFSIEKPEALMTVKFETVGVNISRKRHRVYIGVGSNVGNRGNHINNALNELKQNSHIFSVKASSVIETKPYGYLNQGDFLNCVFEIETELSAKKLLDLLHDIENANGRVREIHWGQRTLDLDILLYDDLIMDEPDLCIPHIDMRNRLFVLRPLLELNNNLVHPVYKKYIKDMLGDIDIEGDQTI